MNTYKKKSFLETQSLNALNIDYFWTFSPHHSGLVGVSLNYLPTNVKKPYAQQTFVCQTAKCRECSQVSLKF